MLLAFDTSTERIGMALFDGAQVVSEETWKSHNYHTVELVPAIELLLKRSAVAYDDLTALGVALGPGSFTSLRIGFAVLKGLSLALKLPVAGIPSLDILAAGQAPLDIPLMAVLHAGRGRLAYSRYLYQDNTWCKQEDAKVIEVTELAQQINLPIYICGELTPYEKQILGRKWKSVQIASPANCLRRPAVLAELAWHKLEAGQADDIASLAPIYLHTTNPVLA